MAHTRSLTTFRQAMGPHYDLSALWEEHTYLEFGARDAGATMKTMGMDEAQVGRRTGTACRVERTRRRRQGNAAFKAGRYDEAYRMYTEALEMNGSSAVVARANRAMALLKMKR